MKIYTIKVCVLGETSIGKTSLLYAMKKMETKYIDSTIGVSFHLIEREINDKLYKLNIWDTAGQERYEALLPLYYKNCNIAILVFDVTKMSSYIKMIEYYNKLEDCFKIVIGNKLDLVDKDKFNFNQFDNLKYKIIYTSATKNKNLNMIFNRFDEILPLIRINKIENKIVLEDSYTNSMNCCG